MYRPFWECIFIFFCFKPESVIILIQKNKAFVNKRAEQTNFEPLQILIAGKLSKNIFKFGF